MQIVPYTSYRAHEMLPITLQKSTQRNDDFTLLWCEDLIVELL